MDIKKFYDPPEEKSLGYLEAYCVGFVDGMLGLERQDKLYPGSGHERETTYRDELSFEYYRGNVDGYEASVSSEVRPQDGSR